MSTRYGDHGHPGAAAAAPDSLTAADLRAWIGRAERAIVRHRAQLDRLDASLGDGDHGENLDRGFSAVVAKLDGLPDASTPADVFKLVATTLISTVGGASGPLFGTAYLKAAGAVAGREELDSASIVELLTAARDGLARRAPRSMGTGEAPAAVHDSTDHRAA